MTTFIVSLITIVGSIVLCVVALFLLTWLEVSDLASGLLMAAIIVAFSVIMFCVVTTEASRTQADYNVMMAGRPDCIDKTKDDIICLDEYSGWVYDSVKLQNKLDSIKLKLHGIIKQSTGGR